MATGKKPLVVVTRRLPDSVEMRMRELFDARLNSDDKPMTQAQLVEAAKTADVLVPTVTDHIDRAVLSQSGEQLKLIANFGNGVDNIDVATAVQRGITVTNTPGVLTEDTGRVGDGNPALHSGCDIYIVDAVAEIGDELELVTGFAEHRSIDAIGDGRHQHIGVFHSFGELRLRHRLVVGVEPGVKEFPHPQLDLIGQLARNNDQRLSAFRHLPQTAVSGADSARGCRFSPH